MRHLILLALFAIAVAQPIPGDPYPYDAASADSIAAAKFAAEKFCSSFWVTEPSCGLDSIVSVYTQAVAGKNFFIRFRTTHSFDLKVVRQAKVFTGLSGEVELLMTGVERLNCDSSGGRPFPGATACPTTETTVPETSCTVAADCPVNAFCALPAANKCVATAARKGTCKSRSNVCIMICEDPPRRGCDGNTHCSECQMNGVGVSTAELVAVPSTNPSKAPVVSFSPSTTFHIVAAFIGVLIAFVL